MMPHRSQTLVIARSIGTLLLGLCVAFPGNAQTPDAKKLAGTDKAFKAYRDPRAVALLVAAKAKLNATTSMVVDYEVHGIPSDTWPTKNFDRTDVITLERPNRFRIEHIHGGAIEERILQAVSDGQTITQLMGRFHVAYEKPVRKENFFLGQTFLIQFFFDPNGIRFDPTDGLWGRPVSEFDSNLSAYDKDTKIAYLGERTLEERHYQVVELKYNTKTNDIRQQVYVGDDKLVYQVDTYLDGKVFSQKYQHFRLNGHLGPETWAMANPGRSPVVKTDPVRLGAEAPDFILPGADGKEYTLKQILQGKKGLYICTLDATAAVPTKDPDIHLAQMRVLQEMKNRYEKQGLGIVAIAGHPSITPDMKDEVLVNRLPDLKRFNYPVLIDIDLERGIQGSAYQNFHLNGRNNILLDGKGRVVFASNDFKEKVNQLAFYQALGQLGFKVSAADMENAASERQSFDPDTINQ